MSGRVRANVKDVRSRVSAIEVDCGVRYDVKLAAQVLWNDGRHAFPLPSHPRRDSSCSGTALRRPVQPLHAEPLWCALCSFSLVIQPESTTRRRRGIHWQAPRQPGEQSHRQFEPGRRKGLYHDPRRLRRQDQQPATTGCRPTHAEARANCAKTSVAVSGWLVARHARRDAAVLEA